MAKKTTIGAAAPAEDKDPFEIEAPSDVLDRKRHFGTVMGDQKKRYHQDGKYFDHAGNVVKED